jgi:integrase
MPRRKNSVPSYLLHKPTGQAYVKIPNGVGGYSFTYLGKHGTDESKAEYERILAERRTGAKRPGRASTVLVNHVLIAFTHHAETHYRRLDGTKTQEVAEFKRIGGVVRRLYGHVPAAEFGPRSLKAVREKFLERGWCRKVVNRRVNRVRQMFKWAAEEELVPGSVWQDLSAVGGLSAGRTAARETEPVGPVSWPTVLACLPHVLPPVQAIIELQLLTGMRPGEAVTIRPADIDASGPVWVYRPRHHKMAHKQKLRAIAIGPRAQEVLRAFAPDDPSACYFSPGPAVSENRAKRSEARVTPLWPSHAARYAAKRAVVPKRAAGDRYGVASYRRAITRAAEKVNRAYIDAGVEIDLHVPHWHPNQLRHTHATEVRRRFGLEAAQVALGHERADITQMYAEKNLALAVKVAEEMG